MLDNRLVFCLRLTAAEDLVGPLLSELTESVLPLIWVLILPFNPLVKIVDDFLNLSLANASLSPLTTAILLTFHRFLVFRGIIDVGKLREGLQHPGYCLFGVFSLIIASIVREREDHLRD